jgi:hypothetical protein
LGANKLGRLGLHPIKRGDDFVCHLADFGRRPIACFDDFHKELGQLDPSTGFFDAHIAIGMGKNRLPPGRASTTNLGIRVARAICTLESAWEIHQFFVPTQAFI